MEQVTESDKKKNKSQDEDVGVMIYGNIRIKDIDSGKILVNQRA
jgi:hypothetical protein